MNRAVAFALTMCILGLGTAAAQDKKNDKDKDDPLPLNSQWKGKLTQRGKIMGNKDIPPEFDVTFVVTGRKNKEFDCELRERVGADLVTYVCKGKITGAEKDKDGIKVEFESVSSMALNQEFIAVTRVLYTGAIAGKTLKGTWKISLKKEDTELDGDFSFERQ